MEKSRLNKLLIGAGIAIALLLGLVIGGAVNIADRIFGSGPDPETIASSSLQSMRAQNRLVPFVARFVSVTTSRQRRFGLSTERTLILPGTVRYELDLSKLSEQDVQWEDRSRTLEVRLPEIEIAGPEVDLRAAREYGEGRLLATITNARERLDQANRARAVADLRDQAQAEVPMRLARQAARHAVQQSFALPLKAAGFEDVRVVARFRGEETGEPSTWDVSTSYNEAIEEARRRRAAQGSQ